MLGGDKARQREREREQERKGNRVSPKNISINFRVNTQFKITHVYIPKNRKWNHTGWISRGSYGVPWTKLHENLSIVWQSGRILGGTKPTVLRGCSSSNNHCSILDLKSQLGKWYEHYTITIIHWLSIYTSKNVPYYQPKH